MHPGALTASRIRAETSHFYISVSNFHFHFPFPVSVSIFHFISISCFSICHDFTSIVLIRTMGSFVKLDSLKIISAAA